MNYKQLQENMKTALKHNDVTHLELYRELINKSKKITIDKKMDESCRLSPPDDVVMEAIKKEYKMLKESFEYSKSSKHHQQILKLEEMLPKALTVEDITKIFEDNYEHDIHSGMSKIELFKWYKDFFNTNYNNQCNFGLLKNIIDNH